jgi:pilus assembly protein FimV
MSQKSHFKIRPKLMAYSLKTLSAAVVSTVLFTNAYGAGLGKLTVLSSLGQPLHAEIELTAVSKEESGSLRVKLASADAFRQANIEFNSALYALRFAIEQRGGQQFIRVTSTQPINEPFVDMLLEVSGTNSRLVREYTFLLDPADLRKSRPRHRCRLRGPSRYPGPSRPTSRPLPPNRRGVPAQIEQQPLHRRLKLTAPHRRGGIRSRRAIH